MEGGLLKNILWYLKVCGGFTRLQIYSYNAIFTAILCNILINHIKATTRLSCDITLKI